MAISNEQLEFAKKHFESLINDLMVFSKKHFEIELEPIRKGEFDLLTTVQATWEAYKWYEKAEFQGKIKVSDFPEAHLNYARTDVFKAYIEAIEIIEKKTYQCVDLNIPPETNSPKRMKPTLYN